eukprot:3736996-Alexandrium_andersonii.AAC.1
MGQDNDEGDLGGIWQLTRPKQSGFRQARQACGCHQDGCRYRGLQAQDEGDIDELDWTGQWYPMEELKFTVDSGA